ncbi:MAG TPA: shikimate kinase [Candidatus Anaerostipes excrementavium]|uniref:Shikimate kinase n=1 Tax=Candidatus Anaerostipes excrementavium TaxID=2838463 RepID=A0A9D1WUS2_9FIRM|nr:shikimate kinase [uncultured Anaerostipes sp.]HIX67517.1 shikimate kinase [Candidatus Anaerostipes excrementavium]
MAENKNNYTLVGMPGAGKSTIGVLLAKALGYEFIDTDLVIQRREGKLLKEIIADAGNDGFKKIEEDVNASIEASRAVIAPGGSAIYSDKAMKHFREIGTIIYLKLSYKTVEQRLGDLKARGVVLKKGQTLYDLYCERAPLYEKYADIIVELDHLDIGDSLEKVLENL